MCRPRCLRGLGDCGAQAPQGIWACGDGLCPTRGQTAVGRGARPTGPGLCTSPRGRCPPGLGPVLRSSGATRDLDLGVPSLPAPPLPHPCSPGASPPCWGLALQPRQVHRHLFPRTCSQEPSGGSRGERSRSGGRGRCSIQVSKPSGPPGPRAAPAPAQPRGQLSAGAESGK